MTTVTAPRSGRVDAESFRRTMRHLPTGVVIVTTRSADGAPHGATVNTATSLSLDPPSLLVSLAETSHTLQALLESGVFAVHVLGAGQADLARRFAARSAAERFADLRFGSGASGVPVLPGVAARSECRVSTHHRAHDHRVVVGDVMSVAVQAHRGLVYHHGEYHDLPSVGS